MFDVLMIVLVIILILGNFSLLLIFDRIRDKVMYTSSKLGTKINKLCKIGIVISIIIIIVSAIVLAVFLEL